MSLNDSLTPTKEVTSIMSTGNFDVKGTLTYSRMGNLVFVKGSITATGSTGAVNGLFSNLPMPFGQFNVPTTSGGYVQLRTDGGLRNYSTINGTAYFSFCYICI